MERIGNLIPESLLQQVPTATSFEDYIQKKIDMANQAEGHLKGYDCPLCKNKGYIFKLKNGYETAIDCDCKRIRLSRELIKKSCLTEEITRCTFETFKVSDPHYDMKERMYNKANAFLHDERNPQAFYIGGQSGAGKTHICTAIVGQMLMRCIPVIYMSWIDESRDLKAKVNDSRAYSEAINRYKNIDVLYIDDFLKTGGNKAPTSADITLAFEIINYRFRRSRLQTIISSEFNIGQVSEMDAALGGRISAMAREYCISISPDKTRNYRLKK